MTIHYPKHGARPCGACGSMPMELFKKDLFGFADVVAIHPNVHGTIYIQVSTMSEKQRRFDKIAACAGVKAVLKSGNTIECHFWRQLGPRGARKLWKVSRWQARIHGEGIRWIEVTEEGEEVDDFELPVQAALNLGVRDSALGINRVPSQK